jgi:predicted ATPase
MNNKENRIAYLKAVEKVEKLKLVLVGQDPYPKGANGIAFCKNTFDELFDPFCCGKEVLYSLGLSKEAVEGKYENPVALFYDLLAQGIAFVNISSVLLVHATEKSLSEDKVYNENFLSKTERIVVLGKTKTRQIFDQYYPKRTISETLIHPSGLAKKSDPTEWLNTWRNPYLEKTYLPNLQIKLKEEVMGIKYPANRLLLHMIDESEQAILEKNYNLDIANKDLYSAGEVEEGVHGIERYDDVTYASLWHIKNHLAKGELKNFLDEFTDSKMLSELGINLIKEFPFAKRTVKYKSQSFEINKYPLIAVVEYYKKHSVNLEEVVVKTKEKTKQIGINSIELNNYRRFKKLDRIGLGLINFFVGPNNSGKSTVVEALRMILSYLKQNDLSRFNLASALSDQETAKSFDRIYNISARQSSKNAPITIAAHIDDCLFTVKFFGKDANPFVEELTLENPLFDLKLDFKSKDLEGSITIHKETIAEDQPDVTNRIGLIEKELEDIDLQLQDKLEPIKKAKLADEKNRKQRELKIAKSLKKPKQEYLESSILPFSINRSNLLDYQLDNIFDEIYGDSEIRRKTGDSSDELQANRKHFDLKYKACSNYLAEIIKGVNALEVHYMEGTSVKLSAVVKPNDNQNGILNSINALFKEGVFTEEAIHSTKGFIIEWLKFFELATNIRAQTLEGEVYTIQLFDGTWQHLGDFGLGAQRIVELILGIAKIVHPIEKTENKLEPLILVEEPEAHLHPNLQSALTKFFYKINKAHRLRFVIETHSEYIVRKSQLIGLQEKLFDKADENPFRVIYFDKEKGPYEMKYTKEGLFNRDFGEGFYDAVSEIDFDIFSVNNNLK